MSRGFSARRGPEPRVLTIILAGGEGRRLWPLTAERAKPAVPMAGRYPMVDCVLSNFVNSGLPKIKVLTQYMPDRLNTHIGRGWRLPAVLDQYIEPVPAQQRRGKEWFRGSADAIFQSINVVTDENPDYVCVFGGDHIYKMDVRQMLAFHLESGAEATVAAVPVPLAQAHAFGVIEASSDGRIVRFTEKPATPAEMPERPGYALASMGNYVFTTVTLIEQLKRNASEDQTQHDCGRNMWPAMAEREQRSYVYDFLKNQVPDQPEGERGYWRDVGTIESYFAANMDFVQVQPTFDLYNPRWPVRTWTRPFPPAKFVFADEENARMGIATDSMVSEGCIISGGRIHRSVLSPRGPIHSFD